MTLNGLLPIGSVVLLKESTKRVMITGVAQYGLENGETRRLYDYCGVLYPEGFMNPDEQFLFNDDQIDQLFFVGFQDAEGIAFIDRANAAIARLRAEE